MKRLDDDSRATKWFFAGFFIGAGPTGIADLFVFHVSVFGTMFLAILAGLAVALISVFLFVLTHLDEYKPDPDPREAVAPQMPSYHVSPILDLRGSADSSPHTSARHYITFSERGLQTGAPWPNDGFDFGPDTPGTKDGGRTEATDLAARLNLAVVGPLSSVDPKTWHLLKHSPPKDPKVGT